MKALITNDDGIDSPSLRAIYLALKKAGHDVFAIAPMRQHSGASRAVTVYGPIMTRHIIDGDFDGIGVYGTPADCVKIGLGHMCPFKPDLVISGINQGPNAGPDIYYSGTVAAAAEAAQAKIPAVALSHLNHTGIDDLEEVAEHAIALANKIDWGKIPAGHVMNVNYPSCLLKDAKGLRVCPRSNVPWPNNYEQRHTPHDIDKKNPYWWFASSLDPETFEKGSDRALLNENYITLTPLQFETTDYNLLNQLENMLA